MWSFQISLYCRENNIEPISDYTFFDLWWFTPNERTDAHNSEKCLFDAFQQGGLVKDDRFVMNRTQGVNIEPSDPHVVVEFEVDWKLDRLAFEGEQFFNNPVMHSGVRPIDRVGADRERVQ